MSLGRCRPASPYGNAHLWLRSAPSGVPDAAHKDIDLEQNTVIVRAGKGDKDRRTMLPELLKDDLIRHVGEVKNFYDKDRQNNINGVQLPGALEKKYPDAGKEWAWFWLFPAQSISVDPRTGAIRRCHIYRGALKNILGVRSPLDR